MRILRNSLVIIIVMCLVVSLNVTNAAGATPSVSEVLKQVSDLQNQLFEYQKTNDSLRMEIEKLKLDRSNVTAINAGLTINGINYLRDYTENANTVPTTIMYKGVVYTPTALISKAVGLPYKYDYSNQKIYIGNVLDGQYMSDILDPYFNGFGEKFYKKNQVMTMVGKAYSNGYAIRSSGEDRSIDFSLDGKYKTISGLAGLDDDILLDYVSMSLEFYGDDKYIASYKFKPGDMPKEFKIDVTAVKKLSIRANRAPKTTLNGNFIDLVNVMIR